MMPADYIEVARHVDDPVRLDAAFVNWYLADDGNNLHRLDRRLQRLMTVERWLPLLDEVFFYLGQQLFRICVPALFVVLEGVGYTNLLKKFERKRSVRNSSKNKFIRTAAPFEVTCG